MTVIDESLTARGFTPAHSVPLVYGMQRQILGITIHWWGVYGQTHSGVNNFFVNGPGSTSCHFVASGVPYPRINCLVSPLDAAWHAGNARGNATTIGIECRPEATEADYKVVAELVRWIRDNYGANLPLYPHRYWQATQCPGNYDLAKIDRMAEALKAKPNPVPVPPLKPKPPVAKDDMKLTHERMVHPVKLTLDKGKSTRLYIPGVAGKRAAVTWNLAVEGLAYYDCDVFIQGEGLFDGQSIVVQGFVVTKGNAVGSGYFPQEIHGSADGKFHGTFRLKTPLLSTARLEVAVTPTAPDVVVTNFGADVFAFHA